MPADPNLLHLRCPKCNMMLHVPATGRIHVLTCPQCGNTFLRGDHHARSRKKRFGKEAEPRGEWGVNGAPKDRDRAVRGPNTDSDEQPAESGRKFPGSFIWLLIVAALVTLGILYAQFSPRQRDSLLPGQAKLRANWVTISYPDLVDRDVLTHSGKSVGEVLAMLSKQDGDAVGLVQPFLEPYSLLCNEVLQSVIGLDSVPMTNLTHHYPVGSAQPAYIALFREGHYQLYYSQSHLRIFLKGREPNSAFRKHRPIIRHAISDVANSPGLDVETVSLYCFEHDFTRNRIRLNTTPATHLLAAIDLSPSGRSVGLDGIEDLLTAGVSLEAVEVDGNDDLIFYGKAIRGSTLAGSPLSLADLAVVYRSVFHHGHNAPFVSLDPHEDNRYAKVNFGGLLEDTHAGQVLLEADMQFKAIGTGLDPNTYHSINAHIAKSVPGFLTEDERSIADNEPMGSISLRYWFYPDSIRTVTDGRIGALLSHQFMADVERMDSSVNASSSVRQTIQHLNTHYPQYAEALAPLRELNTLGRCLALIIWLQVMDMDEHVALDELLTVKLPAFQTPRRTLKLLAATTAVLDEGTRLDVDSIRASSKTIPLSHLVRDSNPSVSNDELLAAGSAYCKSMSDEQLLPSRFRHLSTEIKLTEASIDQYSRAMEAQARDIERSESHLDYTSSTSIARHNLLVDEFNAILILHNKLIDQHDILVDRLNSIEFKSRQIVSVGGGIEMRPSAIKAPLHNRNSPILREVRALKEAAYERSRPAAIGTLIRNSVGIRGSRSSPLPGRGKSRSTEDIQRTDLKSSVLSLHRPSNLDEGGAFRIEHPGHLGTAIGRCSPNKSSFVFTRVSD